MRVALFFLAFCFAASAAQAEVRVNEKILQKGLFHDAACTPDTQNPGYNACLCDADVRYPEITGLDNIQVQVALNASLRQDADKAKCKGEAAKDAGAKDQDHASASHHYEVTFFSPTVMGFEFTDWFSTGGAHDNGSVRGDVVDLPRGKTLAVTDLIADKDMADVNRIIYETLAKRPDEGEFRAKIESRKGAFIKQGVCQGCTLILKPDGLHVVFQTYEVASFAEGNMDVPLPLKYASYPPIIQALKNQKPVAPEKK